MKKRWLMAFAVIALSISSAHGQSIPAAKSPLRAEPTPPSRRPMAPRPTNAEAPPINAEQAEAIKQIVNGVLRQVARPNAAAPAPKPEGELRDPTIPNAEIMKAIGADQPRQPSINSLPMVTLKARVAVRNQAPSALLQVEGMPNTIQVRLGSEVPVMTAGGKHVLKVVALDANEVRIEVAPTNDVMTLR